MPNMNQDDYDRHLRAERQAGIEEGRAQIRAELALAYEPTPPVIEIIALYDLLCARDAPDSMIERVIEGFCRRGRTEP